MAEADPQKTFEIGKAEGDLSRLVDRADAGETVVLVRDGVPFAELVPYPKPQVPVRQPGRWKDLLGKISDEDLFSPCFTDEELDQIYNEDIDPARR